MSVMDLRGLSPAPVTVFTRDGEVDYAANAQLAKWLVSIKGVKSLVILGHAGEGTFLTVEERLKLIETYAEAVDGAVPIIAGVTGEGTRVAAQEAKASKAAGATGALVYPNHGWLRFGFQKGAPQDRYRRSGRSPAWSASCSNTLTPPRRPMICKPRSTSPLRRAWSPPRTAYAT